MRRKVGKLLSAVTLAAVIMTAFSSVIYADTKATTTIGFSQNTVAVGEKLTVQVNVSSSSGEISAADVYLNYDENVFASAKKNKYTGGVAIESVTGGGGARLVTALFEFKAIKAGSATFLIDVDNTVVTAGDGYSVLEVVGSSASLNVTAGNNASSVNSLTELSVVGVMEDGKTVDLKLKPDFDPDITEYNLKAPDGTESLSVYAKAKDPQASIETRWTVLDPGKNKTYIDVVALNGDTLTYTINTNVGGPLETEEETTTEDIIETELVTEDATEEVTTAAPEKSEGSEILSTNMILLIVCVVLAIAFFIVLILYIRLKNQIYDGVFGEGGRREREYDDDDEYDDDEYDDDEYEEYEDEADDGDEAESTEYDEDDEEEEEVVVKPKKASKRQKFEDEDLTEEEIEFIKNIRKKNDSDDYFETEFDD